MWQGIRESAEIDWLRRDAERRLAQLQVLDDIDALQKRVDAFAPARRPVHGLGVAGAGRRVPGCPRRSHANAL
jgi:hypothetical protein